MTEDERAAWDRLNAYVDGELPRDEQAAMEERAARDPLLGLQIAGLRQLKREVRRARHSRRPLAAAIAVSLLFGAGLTGYLLASGAGRDRSSLTTLAELAEASPKANSARSGLAVPDLGSAGFRLVSAIAGVGGPDGVGLVYQGPFGCRVALAIVDADADADADGSSLRAGGGRTWKAGDRRYVLVAPRMDLVRFAKLAAAVEDLTRGIEGPDTRIALNESSTGTACRA